MEFYLDLLLFTSTLDLVLISVASVTTAMSSIMTRMCVLSFVFVIIIACSDGTPQRFTKESHPLLASLFNSAQNAKTSSKIGKAQDVKQNPKDQTIPPLTAGGITADLMCSLCHEKKDLECIERHCLNVEQQQKGRTDTGIPLGGSSTGGVLLPGSVSQLHQLQTTQTQVQGTSRGGQLLGQTGLQGINTFQANIPVKSNQQSLSVGQNILPHDTNVKPLSMVPVGSPVLNPSKPMPSGLVKIGGDAPTQGVPVGSGHSVQSMTPQVNDLSVGNAQSQLNMLFSGQMDISKQARPPIHGQPSGHQAGSPTGQNIFNPNTNVQPNQNAMPQQGFINTQFPDNQLSLEQSFGIGNLGNVQTNPINTGMTLGSANIDSFGGEPVQPSPSSLVPLPGDVINVGSVLGMQPGQAPSPSSLQVIRGSNDRQGGRQSPNLPTSGSFGPVVGAADINFGEPVQLPDTQPPALAIGQQFGTPIGEQQSLNLPTSGSFGPDFETANINVGQPVIGQQTGTPTGGEGNQIFVGLPGDTEMNRAGEPQMETIASRAPVNSLPENIPQGNIGFSPDGFIEAGPSSSPIGLGNNQPITGIVVDSNGIPLGPGDGIPLGQGDGMPIGPGDGIPLGPGDGIPLGPGDGIPLGPGDGTPFGHSDGTPLGHSDGTPLGHTDGTPHGHSDGTPHAHGNGVPLGPSDGISLMPSDDIRLMITDSLPLETPAKSNAGQESGPLKHEIAQQEMSFVDFVHSLESGGTRQFMDLSRGVVMSVGEPATPGTQGQFETTTPLVTLSPERKRELNQWSGQLLGSLTSDINH